MTSSNVLALFLLRAGICRPRRYLQPFLSSSLLLLVSDSALGTLAGTSIGLGALAAAGQILAMAGATEALDLDQTLDVQRDVAAQVAFNDDVVFVDVVTDLSLFVQQSDP